MLPPRGMGSSVFTSYFTVLPPRGMGSSVFTSYFTVLPPRGMGSSVFTSYSAPSLVQSSDGSTAMHLASSVGGVALIELMILNGARTDVRDFEGRLPLHWATIPKSPKVIATLLKVS